MGPVLEREVLPRVAKIEVSVMAAGIIAVAGPQFSVTESCHDPHPPLHFVIRRTAEIGGWVCHVPFPFSFTSTLKFVFFIACLCLVVSHDFAEEYIEH